MSETEKLENSWTGGINSVHVLNRLEQIRNIALKYAAHAINNGHSDAAINGLSVALKATNDMSDFISR